MIHLSSQNIQIVKNILKRNIPERHVLVFGSRVTEKFKPHSDLDLCILGETPLSFEQLDNLRESFSESDLPIRVDLVDWATITPEFRKVIKKNQLSWFDS
jgi:predicted nucleotidyltransferase